MMTNTKKLERRQGAAIRLNNQLASGVKTVNNDEGVPTEVPLTEDDRKRISNELEALSNYMQGAKKRRKRKKMIETTATSDSKEKWYIEISSVSFSHSKKSEIRKSKGKSRKKTKRVKSVSFVRRVVAREGDITAYRDGRMGISPKNHIFKMVRETSL